MNLQKVALAKKYAISFLNVFSPISFEQYQEFIAAQKRFTKIQKQLVLLTIPLLSKMIKKKIISNLLHQFSLPKGIEPLINLLIAQHRITLLPLIFQQIITEYEKRNSITRFVITTASPISDEQRTIIIDFLTKKTGGRIIDTITIDKVIIAGLRLQSMTNLWEFSIAKQLRSMNNALTQ